MTAALATHPHVIHYSVDDEPQETTKKELTPRQIMEDAKPKRIDPESHYLVLIQGEHRHSYKDHPDEIIHMHEGMCFISVSTGPTPVS
jgi:hypothetical protein